MTSLLLVDFRAVDDMVVVRGERKAVAVERRRRRMLMTIVLMVVCDDVFGAADSILVRMA